MSRSDLPSQSCTIARAVAQVGDEWTLLIVREMFLGTRRFDDFLRLTGMSFPPSVTAFEKKLETQGFNPARALFRAPAHAMSTT